ncbi:MAG: ComEC/Rec2 family competence protein [Patescibacteria group bacterium]|jgi:competence protein ComEC
MRKFVALSIVLAIFITLGSKQLGRPAAFIAFLDVGQGDATVIQLADNTTILIDAGPDRSVVEQLDRVLPYFDRTIELAVVTHPDTDHYAGFGELMERYTFDQFWIASDKPGAWETFRQNIQERGIAIERPVPGRRLQFFDGASIVVLWPLENDSEDSNEMSIVLQFLTGDASFFLTGDASITVEQQILARNPDIHADILRLGHHGSHTSSDPAFIKNIAPELAIISCGAENRFGHPHQEVLDILHHQGIPYLRTDHFGSILFFLDAPLQPVHLDKACLFC